MLKKVKKTINTYNMVDNDKPIIVGVSGGADSMALLDVLSKIVSNKLIVAHLNHKFRGHEADKDAEFVRIESKKMGITAIIKEFDVPSYMKKTNLGAQVAARQVRYHFYSDVAEEWNSEVIALGHHADDQAETLLLRLIRGTGLQGLSGIPYKRDFNGINIIRPLLDIQRKEIENYCSTNLITYITDQSNFSTKYFRNEIRLNVIPMLSNYNEKFSQHLHQLAKVTQDENNYLNNIAEIFMENNLTINEAEYILDTKKLIDIDIALQRRVIYLILKYLKLNNDITYCNIDDILNLINQSHPSKSIDLPGAKAYRQYEKLVFTQVKIDKKEEYFYQLEMNNVILISEINKKVKMLIKDIYVEQEDVFAVFDYDELKGEILIARSRRDGDRIELPGVKGSKKVKDIFIDLKVPLDKRENFPIIECSGKILWLAGIRRSKYAYVNKKTKKYLYVIVSDY